MGGINKLVFLFLFCFGSKTRIPNSHKSPPRKETERLDLEKPKSAIQRYLEDSIRICGSFPPCSTGGLQLVHLNLLEIKEFDFKFKFIF